ncbi:MAG: PIG-L family deacetylase [Anaerolineaceae bacterium]|nr:PIG-L family deacetylase [Anaerolineaceae bacterium]
MLNKKRLLVIQAHPDDESFGVGGTLAWYARQGIEITLVTATGGEVGPIPERFKEAADSPKAIRAKELDCAVKVLGISRLIRLGYQDSGMRGWETNKDPNAFINQPVAEVSKRLLEIMLAFEPQVVLTHNAKGDYGHPDHIHVYECTAQAFREYLARNEQAPHQGPGPILYAHLMSRSMLKAAVFFYRLSGKDPHHFGENGDVDLVELAEINFPVHAFIKYRSVQKAKEAASACHASQGGGKIGTGFQNLIQKLIEKPQDAFTQVLPQPLNNQKIKTDLFEGRL